MTLSRRLRNVWISATRGTGAMRRESQTTALVLMYHEVLPDDINVPSWLVVRRSHFIAQMTWLREHFEVVDLGKALDRLRFGATQELPRRPLAVVTMDDGYAGNLTCALPVMRQLRLPFTVYVATAILQRAGRFWYDDLACALLARGSYPVTIDTSQGALRYEPGFAHPARRWARIDRLLSAVKKLPPQERRAVADSLEGSGCNPELRMLTRSELCSLSHDPLVTIGNHTRGHELLDQLALDEARMTILGAQQDLVDCIGSPPNHFCYPNGSYSVETLQTVRDLGFTTATTTRPGLWSDPAQRLEIPRIPVGRFDTLNRLRSRVTEF